MGKYGYTEASLEEFFEASEDATLFALPAKAITELAAAKKMPAQADVVTKTLRKYLINARQAQTNAKIVEALLA